ncbi:hypothetical protein [Nostoc piscinale]|uniref:hypothetical protein n=1 Tax=Nostoc piscinale TaxID=224012 RepID=UPI000ACB8F5D|nr:hypothetical protein [Nostoc piscinale]
MKIGCKGVRVCGGRVLDTYTPIHLYPYTLAKTLDFSFLCVIPKSFTSCLVQNMEYGILFAECTEIKQQYGILLAESTKISKQFDKMS